MDKDKEIELIKLLQQGDRIAQKELFDKFAPKLLAIAYRYAGSKQEAEDILQEAFIKIFENIKKFRMEGSFEGWLRRIVINTAIIHYHKTAKYRYHQDFETIRESDISFYKDIYNEADFTWEELMKVIQSLPKGYRTVFNLYAIEGYKHKEIAKMLGIDENTSKSQYHRAKKLLRKKLLQLKKIRNDK